MQKVGSRAQWVQFVLVVAAVVSACGVERQDTIMPAAATCIDSTSPEALSGLFAREPGGVIAADYQRAVALPDGRTLWMFQDATIRLPPPAEPDPDEPDPDEPDPDEPDPPTTRLLHNIGMVQTGTCFEVLKSGSDVDPRSWLLADETTPFAHWFWPLDAEFGSDGRLYVYLAEVFERGGLYLSVTEPVGTRIVGLDVATMTTTFGGVPPGSSTSLYGFSIVSDDSWTYLYGHCHRQFGWDIGPFGVPAHDRSCSANVPVARVPRGFLFDPMNYWDGTTWQPNPDRAVAVIPTTGRAINPSQIRRHREGFVAVTKVNDWFGSTIYLDRAPAAEGPWTNYARLPATPRCARTTCNTYFASWIPGEVDGDFVIGLSHNRWDGVVSTINRPSFQPAPPPENFAVALRCAIVDC